MRARVRQPAHAVQLHVIAVEQVPPVADLDPSTSDGNARQVAVTGEITSGEKNESVTVTVTAELSSAQVPAPGQVLAARVVRSSPPRVWVEWPGVEALPLTGPPQTLTALRDELDPP